MSYQIPATCPCCSTALVRDGAHYFCPNETGCMDQVVQRLQHAVGKSALDWDGFGIKTVEKLTLAGVRQFSDILGLPTAEVERLFGPAQARQFLSERERVKKAPLWRKLVALGIDLVGVTACRELCADKHSLVDIAGLGESGLTQRLGPVAAKNTVKFLQTHLGELDRCEQYGYMFHDEAPPAPTTAANSNVAGKSFCITGTLLSGTRTAVSRRIEAAGGEVKGSVTKGLDYLVVGEGGGANKAAAARKYGTVCIDEKELYELLGVPQPVVTAAGFDSEY